MTTMNAHDATVECLRILSGVCDGAHERDDVGFNATDTGFGKSLARQTYRLTMNQLRAARKMLVKYKRQLPPDLYEIVVHGAPAPAVAQETPTP